MTSTRPRRRTLGIVADVCAGALIGLAVLHPLSMLIVSQPAMQGHDGHSGHAMTFDARHLLASPMAWYFVALGVSMGLLSGWFRRELSKRNDALRTALSEKENLLRVLTHDLANSMAASLTFLEVGIECAGADLSPDSRTDFESASKALAQGRELMDFTRTWLAIEAGKIQIQPVARDVHELVSECLELFRQRCVAKGITIEVATRPGHYRALVEPVILKNSIINNLLSNAVKFSVPEQRIRVEVSAEGRWVFLSVTNTGPAISPTRIATIFSANGRTTTSGTAGERGTGFGLPLAHRYSRAMGGALSVESRTVGNGEQSVNTFRVRLPAAG